MRDNGKLDVDDVMDKCVCVCEGPGCLNVCNNVNVLARALVHKCVHVSLFSNKDKSTLIITPKP